MLIRAGVPLVDLAEEHWWSLNGLYKPNEVYREELLLYKKNLSLVGGRSEKVDSEWTCSTDKGTLGELSDDPVEYRSIDVINELFYRESSCGGNPKAENECVSGHSLQKHVVVR